MADLVALTSRLKAKGVALNILAMQLDTDLMGWTAAASRAGML
jgi:hypothetical protein